MIRFHPITGEPLLLAPARAGRPNAFAGRRGPGNEHDPPPATLCPFCPGHERETPPEVARVPAGDAEPWRLRAFPNKYPATPHHEVIVESPRHDALFHELRPADAAAAVLLYAGRYRAQRDEARCVTIFKNHGPRAGASLSHLHSQILGTPFVTPRVAREIDGFTRAAECPLCPLPGALIEQTDSFAWIAPHGSALPYQSWIVPRTHAPELVPPAGVTELAAVLQQAARAVLTLSSSFNWMFLNFAGAPCAHWYVEIVPRMTTLAGFELGSGSGINVVDPGHAAEVLRGR